MYPSLLSCTSRFLLLFSPRIHSNILPSRYLISKIGQPATGITVVRGKMLSTGGNDEVNWGFTEFLAKSSEIAREGFTGTDIVHVVMGNEACDADSICSALALAYMKSIAPSTTLRPEDTRSTIFVPVMPIPRKDLALRQEVLVLFNLCDVNPASVTFTDEVDLAALHAQDRLRLSLTDHNAISGGLTGIGDAVVEIVDHHLDTGKHLQVQGESRDIAFNVGAEIGQGKALVGSCCTMVAERLLATVPDRVTPDLARLLLGVILIDTANLDPAIKRATQRDHAISQRLAQKSKGKENDASTTRQGEDRPEGSSDSLYSALRDAKFKPSFWIGLAHSDCLRYDYKQFPTGLTPERHKGGGGNPGGSSSFFGMSSILCRMGEFARKPGVLEAMKAFTRAHGLDALVVMSLVVDPGPQRELLVFSEDQRRLRGIVEFLEGPDGEALGLEKGGLLPAEEGVAERGAEARKAGLGKGLQGGREAGHVVYWVQSNPSLSRKQVAPLMTEFYGSLNVGNRKP
ncbi:unnamed protein product [Discosporangium mesarthrocarpum]